MFLSRIKDNPQSLQLLLYPRSSAMKPCPMCQLQYFVVLSSSILLKSGIITPSMCFVLIYVIKVTIVPYSSTKHHLLRLIFKRNNHTYQKYFIYKLFSFCFTLDSLIEDNDCNQYIHKLPPPLSAPFCLLEDKLWAS